MKTELKEATGIIKFLRRLVTNCSETDNTFISIWPNVKVKAEGLAWLTVLLKSQLEATSQYARWKETAQASSQFTYM